MYAHITNGTVDFVLQVEPATIFAANYASEFISAPENVEIGWSYDGEAFTSPTPYVRPPEEVIAEKVEQLWQAADKYSTGYISGVAVGILTIGVIQSNPKALAVTAWSNGLWSEYYARKALITVDSALDLDFSVAGPMPYSVPELQAEIGL